MMVHKMSGRGTYRLDRIIDGVGRINRASGTHDPKTFKAIDALLTTLASQGRHDLLREVKNGRLKAVVLYAWHREGKLDHAPAGETLRPFLEAWDPWVKSLDRPSEGHLKDLRETVKALAPGRALLNDSPELLRALLVTKAGKARTLQKAKANLQAFLRDTLGRDHRLYQAVRAVRTPRVVVEAKGRPLGLVEVRALMARLDPETAAVVWTACATGMNTKELFGVWRVERDRVVIEGTKRAGRNRVVPFWTPVVRPTLSLMTLRRRLAKASGGSVRIKDFRNTFARWTEEAGIIETNAAAYMGHGAKTMTHWYRIGVIEGQLATDAEKLRALVGAPGLRLAEEA